MDTHLCYKCLLVSEPDLRNEMQRLCLLRQVAWIACTDGYPLKELDLGVRIGELQNWENLPWDTYRQLGCRAKEVATLSQRLVTEKYLRKISRPQSKKHKDYNRRSQIPPYEFLTEESERLLKEYLNPTFKIEEYVSIYRWIPLPHHSRPRNQPPNVSQLHEHSQATSDSPQQSSPTPPHNSNSSLSSISPEFERSIPNAIPPMTPHSKLDSTGPIFGIFCGDDVDTTKTLSAAEMATASSMYASTQGTPSHVGSPDPRPAIGVKRKGSALERSGRKRKQPSWVNSPFVLKRGLREWTCCGDGVLRWLEFVGGLGLALHFVSLIKLLDWGVFWRSALGFAWVLERAVAGANKEVYAGIYICWVWLKWEGRNHIYITSNLVFCRSIF